MNILPLRVTELEPPPLTTGAQGVTVWRDAAGYDVVFAATTDEWHWVRVDGVGTYRFALASPELQVAADAMPEDGASPSYLIDSYYRTIVPMALHAYGLETLHGSAVELAGGVVALCAPPRSGKSTIAYALGSRGHRVLADDAVVLNVNAPSRLPEVVPLPFELRLREPSARHFQRPSKNEVTVTEGSQAPSARLPLTAVVVLSRGAVEISVKRLSAEDAFKELLAQSQVFSVAESGRKGEMMRAYLKLAALLPVYKLCYPTGLEVLDEVCARIEELGLTAGVSGQLPVTPAPNQGNTGANVSS